MIIYRAASFLCFIGASAAPACAAFVCQLSSTIAVKNAFPFLRGPKFPGITELWVFPIANGAFPLVPVALIISTLIAASGLYLLISKRPRPEAASGGLFIIYTIGFAVAFAALAITLIGIVTPFIPMSSNPGSAVMPK